MQRLELGGGAAVGVAVAALVVAVEGLADAGRVVAPGDRHLDVVALARVAHLGVALEQHAAGAELADERGARLLLHLGEALLQRRDSCVIERAHEGLGEIEPGVRWILTPGHSNGLISICVDTDDGLVVIASDCVGPLPEYFDAMNLPEDFGPERDELLTQWRRIRELNPAVVIPGHNPPVRLG